MADTKQKPVSQAETNRNRELARRQAQKEATKRAQAESVIVHGPVRS